MAAIPTVKPSARAADRAAKAARLNPLTTKLAARFKFDGEPWGREYALAKRANERIDELLNYIRVMGAGELIAMLIDLRGERDVMIDVIRDMRLELAGLVDHDEDRDALSVEELCVRAQHIEHTHNHRSERRLRGEYAGGL